MPTIPCAVADGVPGALVPSSRTDTDSVSPHRVTVTDACAAPACFSVLVSASWTIRYAVRPTPGGLGLDRDQADRMADDVVQFAGDAQPLVGDGPRHPPRLLALGPFDPFGHIGAADADGIPGGPGDRDGESGHEQVERADAARV